MAVVRGIHQALLVCAVVSLAAIPQAWAVSGSACVISGCTGSGGSAGGLTCSNINTAWCFTHESPHPKVAKGGIQRCSGPDANSTSTTCVWTACGSRSDGCCVGLVQEFTMKKPIGFGCSGCQAKCVPYPGSPTPAPSPGPVQRCNSTDSGGCVNSCPACCKPYISDGAACANCIKAECPAPSPGPTPGPRPPPSPPSPPKVHRECNPGAPGGCNVCAARQDFAEHYIAELRPGSSLLRSALRFHGQACCSPDIPDGQPCDSCFELQC